MNKKTVGIKAIQNFRDYMEDTHIVTTYNRGTLCGVFDGHGGPEVAEFLRDNLKKAFVKNKKKVKNVRKALKNTLKELDLIAKKLGLGSKSGACATVYYLKGRTLYWAHVGDTRLYVITTKSVKRLNTFHDRDNDKENERMEKAGAILSGPYFRVPGVGGIQLSRSVGDEDYKTHGLICEPESRSTKIPKSTLYLVNATDGMKLNVDKMAEIARSESDPELLADKLNNISYSSDNRTIVALKTK